MDESCNNFDIFFEFSMVSFKIYLYLNLIYFKKDEIEINNGTVNLNTETVWGVLRGLESFSQLTYVTEKKQV